MEAEVLMSVPIRTIYFTDCVRYALLTYRDATDEDQSFDHTSNLLTRQNRHNLVQHQKEYLVYVSISLLKLIETG